jgi:hypothetical protein
VRGGALRGWSWAGLPGAAPDYEVALEANSLAARCAREGTVQSNTGTAASDEDVLSPRHHERAAVALPVHVEGRVVAVLYGDDDTDEARAVPSAWPEWLEVLARHAGRCLEAVTIRRLPELAAASAAAHAANGALAPDEAAAERCARLLVAEIKLYHESAVEDARRDGDILRRLRPYIERAQELYRERVPASIRSRTDYFNQELVRTLAGGDPARLGQAS